jgi:putative ABC transport system permease protein
LAIPIGYWVMNKWLEKFVFRTKIEVSVFLISGAISLLVALLAILYNTIRAANANPAHALKSL